MIMNEINNKHEITDEQLACYIEGKVTEKERVEIEYYIEQDPDLFNALMTAHADVMYDHVIRRLNEETFWKRTRFYIFGIAVLIIAGIAAFTIWRLATPLNMKINIVEDTEHSIPAMPFTEGSLQCEYAGNTVQTIGVTADNKTIFLNDIPFRDRKTDVHVVFTSNGYETIDTIVTVQKALSLNIKRNNDLGLIFGRVTDFKTGMPVENATVKLLDMQTVTDAFGQFRIEIPFAKQDKAQRVQILKEGYPVWEGFYRPSQIEPWNVVLGD